MSYQEKNITVSLMSYILLLGFYVMNLFQMYQTSGLVADRLFRLAGVVIVAGILVTILASILTNIILSIVESIKAGKEQNPRFIEDERDKLIELKGIKFSYIVFSVGVLLAMLSFVFGQPALVMFSLIIASGLVAEIVGDIFQIVLYRRGF